MKKIIIICLILAAAVLVHGQQRVFMDSQGRKVAIEKVPERIVVTSPEVQEILFRLGLGSKIVGNVKQCDYPAEGKKIKKAGDFNKPDIEIISKLKPDLVIITDYVQHGTVENLVKLKYPVFVVYIKNIIELNYQIQVLGNIFKKQSEAVKLIQEINEGLASLKSPVTPVKVLPVLWLDPVSTAGRFTLIDDVITRAGGINLAASAGRDYFSIDEEFIFQNKPDYILICDKNLDIRKKIPLLFIKYPDIKVIDSIEPDLILRAGPRLMDGIKKLNAVLVP